MSQRSQICRIALFSRDLSVIVLIVLIVPIVLIVLIVLIVINVINDYNLCLCLCNVSSSL